MVKSKLETIENLLNTKKNWDLLVREEKTNISALKRSYHHLPLHTVNFSISPKKELYKPDDIEAWFNEVVNSTNLKTEMYRETKLYLKSAYGRNIYDFQPICIDHFNIGFAVFKESIGFNCLGSHLNYDNEDEGKFWPELNERIGIFPYITKNHFQNNSGYSKIARQNIVNYMSDNQGYIKFDDAIKYLSEEKGKLFRQMLLDMLKSKKVHYVRIGNEEISR